MNGEDLGLVAQVVGDVDLVEPRVVRCEVDELKGAVRGVDVHPTVQLPQDDGRWREADRVAADGDVLALLHLRRWEHLHCRIPGWCCE